MSRQGIAPPMKAKGMVHKMLADVAKGCAEAAYEGLAKQNKFYRQWPDRRPFIEKFWPNYLPVARTILVGMLGDPKRSDEEKEIIADVILKDGAVNPKKMAAPEKPRFFTGPKS